MYIKVFRHKKRGSLYHVIGMALITAKDLSSVKDDSELVLTAEEVGGLRLIPQDEVSDYTDERSFIFGKVRFQRQDSTVLDYNSRIVVYRAEDNTVWGRESGEFMDGRFELVGQIPMEPY